MDFEIPPDIQQLIAEVDAFIEAEIKPLEQQHDNARFFDHRREHSRTDWDNDGQPRPEWEALLQDVKGRADRAGLFRAQLPVELGGRGLSNLAMAILREHMATRGLGLHNDLQNEHSIIGNLPTVEMIHTWGTQEQKDSMIEKMIKFEYRVAFGLTEPSHGSDAAHMDTRAVRDGDEWVIDGAKRFNSWMHTSTHDIVFARTSGSAGDGRGITAFIVPMDTPGIEVDFMWWTFNMPTDHAEVSIRDCRVPSSCILGEVDMGLPVAGTFVHENRIRQAASSVGAAQYCINEAVKYARERRTWNRPLMVNQGIQFPLVELHSEAELVRNLVYKTAWEVDRRNKSSVEHMIAMANFRANRLACEAADRAMQVHGGYGYTRHVPFEHIYRHHRRYRITEGAEEVQMRKVAKELFGI
ncbi:MAG TPA: acyl-CoA dehydrogenase family protein [Solirubrobacteraceae bacterium]|jgi:alkylation response protein AidB-like acyl-CoA dehydrogenase|nr:acyl-CoA dehydrogenase family protein [Solirubrobacteraceae bacterium]